MGISVSEKHGVNPSIPICFYCGEGKNEVALLGKLKGDVEAPHYCLLDMEPCDLCKERRESGIHLIIVSGDQTDEIEDQRRRHEEYEPRARRSMQRPVPFIPQVDRAGWTCWVSREDFPGMVKDAPKLLAQIMRAGWVFMPKEAADMLGLTAIHEKAMEEHPDAKEIVCKDVVKPKQEDDPPCDDQNTLNS
jgi:hypothetical protein